MIVNAKNSISKLTTEEIGRIFRGEVTNWEDVGGTDEEISLYGRQSSSGTFVFFREMVLEGEYAATMNQMNGNAQIVEAVGNDKSGIGYVGVGYVKGTGQDQSAVRGSDSGGRIHKPAQCGRRGIRQVPDLEAA